MRGPCASLDAFDLLLIEQPLAEDDIRQHAELARLIRTPICLDESVVSVRAAADAIALQACPGDQHQGRPGRRLPRRPAGPRPVPGQRDPGVVRRMLETGLGRAANAALAALPGFTLPALSASDRFYDRDITEPFLLEDGADRCADRAGLGVEPIQDVLEAFTVSTEWIQPT